MKQQQVSGSFSLPYTAQAESTAYLIATLLIGPIAVLAILATFKHPVNWPAPAILLAILLAFFAFIGWFKINLERDRIKYRAPRFKERTLLFSEIRKLKIEIGLARSSKQQGFYRLAVYPNSKKDVILINMKPFSKRDLSIVVNAITAANPSVELDKLTRELKEGHFKPIVSAGLRKMWQIILFLIGLFLALTIVHAIR